MTLINIKTSKKEIIKSMYSEKWVTIDAIIENKITIELILMFQHGVVPQNEPNVDFDNDLFLNITIAGQIQGHKDQIEKCKEGGQYIDVFYEGIAIMHNKQISILCGLKNLMLTQYN